MPGLDGTGPRGLGPMSGRGRGLCILKLPDRPDESAEGLAGRIGWPVSPPQASRMELARLRQQARHLETILRALRTRINQLDATT